MSDEKLFELADEVGRVLAKANPQVNTRWCDNCADGEPPARSKPWTCARVMRKESACNMHDEWRPIVNDNGISR